MVVSIFGSDSLVDHLKLGHALSPLRDQNVVIIGSGMTVHNLDPPKCDVSGGVDPFYLSRADEFNDAAVFAATDDVGLVRENQLHELYEREDIRLFHPSLEHILPLGVCCGAAGEDAGRCLFNYVDYDGLGWSNIVFASG
jgi:aromatic ring-opening dioxygenase catalytic subunit (LigB family)